MQSYNCSWYAAFVKTGEEDDVKARLEYRFGSQLKFLFPRRDLRERKGGRWHNVLRPLFPGYLLINGRVGAEEYYKLKSIPGLWRLLLSDGELLPIPPGEIDFISRLVSESEVIGPSSLEEAGGCVRITDGPLIGMEGHIVKVDKRKGRAKVRMTFLNEERVVDLGINLLAQV